MMKWSRRLVWRGYVNGGSDGVGGSYGGEC